jgi:hypothetical protein
MMGEIVGGFGVQFEGRMPDRQPKIRLPKIRDALDG